MWMIKRKKEQEQKMKKLQETNRRKIFVQGMCIFAIILVFLGERGLKNIFAVPWISFLLSIAIQILLLAFYVGYEKNFILRLLIIFVLFLVSWCITYEGIAQILYQSSYMSNIIQKNMSDADSECCNALNEFAVQQIAQRENIMENYMQEINLLIDINADEDEIINNAVENEMNIYEHEILLKNNLKNAKSKNEIVEILDTIYQDTINANISVNNNILFNYQFFQDNVTQLFQLLKIKEDISKLYINEKISVRTAVNEKIWIERMADIVNCKKKLEEFGIDQDKRFCLAINDMETQLRECILDMNRIEKHIKLLFDGTNLYWDKYIACMLAALILNVIELMLAAAFVYQCKEMPNKKMERMHDRYGK